VGDENQANRHFQRSLSSKGEYPPAYSRPKKRFYTFLLTFPIMFAVWLLLSGKFDIFHLSLGVVSCAIVAYISGDLLFGSPQIMRLPGTWLRFIRYIPWLFYQVFRANLHVLYLTFHPRMHDLINPKIINFKSKLYSDISLVTFANSITLTPGTITVYVSGDGEFHVHAIDDQSAQGLPGEMEARIAKAFREE
jgi:multicomponent Na+:H+ antiporter subunit E